MASGFIANAQEKPLKNQGLFLYALTRIKTKTMAALCVLAALQGEGATDHGVSAVKEVPYHIPRYRSE